MITDQFPIVLANLKAAQPFDGDCACPTPSAKQRTDVYSSALWQIAPSLYRADLHEEHELVFNYLGSASIAVLNRPARDILNSFGVPQGFGSQRDILSFLNPDPKLAAIKKFVDLGLLVQPNALPENKKYKADTLTVWLHVTNTCNLACDYCYLDKTAQQMDIERGKQAIDAVFRSASSNEFSHIKLKYAGGEPTLNFPLILKLHEYAVHLADGNGLAMEGVILTNGVLLSSQMIEDIKKAGLHLSISLDGIGNNINFQRRLISGRDSFAHVEQTLDRLAGSGVIPSITITITSRNLKSLPEIVHYVLKRNLPFALNFYRENDCASSFTDLAFQDDEVIHYMRAAFKVIEENLPLHSLLGSLLDRTRLDIHHEKTCGVGSSYMVIDPNGGVSKCHMEIKKNVTNISVEDPLQMLRADRSGIMNYSVDEKKDCRDCTWRYWCGGGCPALTYRVTGSFAAKSPNCQIYKALLPEVLRLEGLRLLKYG